MKSLQEAFQKQLNEAAEKAEKQQATVSNFSSFFVIIFSNLSMPLSSVNASIAQICLHEQGCWYILNIL